MSNSPTKMVDVVHAELLTDVQKLRVEVKKFSDEIPALYKSVKDDIEESSAKVKETFKDFDSMGKALALHINKTKSEGVTELQKATEKNADFITKSLEPYTKYFWLLIGLGVVIGVLQLLTLLAVVFLR